MSDEELIARLRDWQEHDEGKINDTRAAAADRIEALLEQCEGLAQVVDYNWVKHQRVIAAEAKLAKAMEVLEQCEIMLRLRGHDEVAANARNTLAEIKGESQDGMV